jgi:hypothetical protein
MKPGDPGFTMAIIRSDVGLKFFESARKQGYIIAQEFDLKEKMPAGAQLKKRRNPFLHQRRARYGLPVPDFGFLLGHEPGQAKSIHRAPSFDEPIVTITE